MISLSNLLEKTSTNNATIITIKLIRDLKIPITTTTIVAELEGHPKFPSLLCISDFLNKWGIDHLALRVKTESLDSLPTPFIAHTKNGTGNFVLVRSIGGEVNFIDENGTNKNLSRDAFLNEWDKVVLLVNKDVYIGDPNYLSKRKHELRTYLRMPIVIFGFATLMLLGILFNSFLEIFASLMIFLKLLGSVVCSMLLWFEIDKANLALRKICSSGKRTNCSAVLDSPGAKFTKLVSWSEIGFFYFSGGFLFMLIGGVSFAFPLISIFNLIVLPYVVFSIYYQWKVIKQWCPLCLTVQVILVCEFITSYFGFWATNNYLLWERTNIVSLITSYLLPILFWVATKPIYNLAENSKQLKKDLTRLKNNREILDALLKRQKSIVGSTEGLGITIGNPDAKNLLIKVCNPYCKPCSKAHPIIDEIISRNPNIKCQIIFTGVKHDPNENRALIIKYLLALNNHHGSGIDMNKVLDDWYIHTNRNFSMFSTKYSFSLDLENQMKSLNLMGQWCDENNILYTPTYFLNGYQLPDPYVIEDLKDIVL